jgi:hypothetical protein
MNKQFFTWGTVVVGVAFIVAGLLMLYLGEHTRTELTNGLLAENLEVSDPAILLTYEGARAPEGVEVPTVVIDDGMEAKAQAAVIRVHTLARTEGLTYSQMDREDPLRAFYLDSLVLQSALHQAHVGFEIVYLVLGIGTAFTGLGLAILVLWLPVVRKVVALK